MRTSGLMRQNQSRCDSAPPVSSSRGPKFIGLNKDLTQSYSLCFHTESGTVSKRKASDTEVSKTMRFCQLIIELAAVLTFGPQYNPLKLSLNFIAHRGAKQEHRPDRTKLQI